jgi:hypothetical protein
MVPLPMSERIQRPYVQIDSRTSTAEVIRGWPIPASSEARTEVSTLLYLGTVGLLRTLVQLFPDQRRTISDYLRDVAEAIDSGTW